MASSKDMVEPHTNDHDAFITNVLLGIAGFGFLIGALIGGLLSGLVIAFVLFALPYTWWCIFFRAPPARGWIVAGIVCIPLYLCYVLFVMSH